MDETKTKDKIIGLIFAAFIIVAIVYGIGSISQGTSNTNNISLTDKNIQTAGVDN